MSLAVAKQYAKALLEVASKPGSTLDPGIALEQLKSFEEVMGDSAELKEFMLTPAIDYLKKHRALGRIADRLGFHPLVRNFLNVVTTHRRAALFGEIRQMYQAALDEKLGVARAQVHSAMTLDEVQRQALVAELGRKTGRKVECEYSVDPSLIGGVTVRIDSTIYDGSVQGQLEGLRRKLESQA